MKKIIAAGNLCPHRCARADRRARRRRCNRRAAAVGWLPGHAAQVPLKVQLVVSRYSGEKKIEQRPLHAVGRCQRQRQDEPPDGSRRAGAEDDVQRPPKERRLPCQ